MDDTPPNTAASPLREQVANTLLRARKLAPGPYKNDLRQLGVNLLRLYKLGPPSHVMLDGAAEQSGFFDFERVQ
jgi:hypothetical protein